MAKLHGFLPSLLDLYTANMAKLSCYAGIDSEIDQQALYRPYMVRNALGSVASGLLYKPWPSSMDFCPVCWICILQIWPNSAVMQVLTLKLISKHYTDHIWLEMLLEVLQVVSCTSHGQAPWISAQFAGFVYCKYG